ncbi:flagellar hook-basal body protein [Marinicellulosiphila megalodicopiae]|uniref:flagellar hook-basal body protein n=1 Tax=Marinicellulosiphila megalodicopiae TaxID=2724896 RepID=UPI003BAF25A9
MIDAITIAESGIQSQQKVIDQISNNMANLNTNAYKKSSMEFSQLVNTDSSNQLLGVSSHQYLDFSEGPLKQTGLPLDFAIRGDGFFEVENAQGERLYTRLGRFVTDEFGYLKTQEGYFLTTNVRVPENATSVMVDSDGTVKATYPGSNVLKEIGEINILSFSNPQGLELNSGGFYNTTQQSGDPEITNDSLIVQGSLEASNVDIISEMGEMMLAQHSYQMNSKILQVSDEILGIINNLKR